MRSELRASKRQTYLDAAGRILVRSGSDALTMSEIAREVGAAVGTVYGYFSSKSALIAELQLVVIDRIVAAWSEVSASWRAAFVEAGLDEADRAVAGMLSFGEFYVELQREFPEEFRLQQLQLNDRGQLLDPEAVERLMPAASRLLRIPLETIEEATRVGVIDTPAEVLDRTMVLALALGGVAQVGNVAGLDGLVSIVELTRHLVDDLVTGWGVPVARVAVARAVVNRVVAERPLVHPGSVREIDLTDV